MNSLALLAIIFMVLALFSYTISIWGARRTKGLKRIHVILNWVGLICDTTGTIFMLLLAGGLSWSLHSIFGILAISMMLVNGILATLAYKKRQAALTSRYLEVSLFFWIIWLISFLAGMVLSMR
jgi:uncharacterized repeat protein (TIGR03987 family)